MISVQRKTRADLSAARFHFLRHLARGGNEDFADCVRALASVRFALFEASGDPCVAELPLLSASRFERRALSSSVFSADQSASSKTSLWAPSIASGEKACPTRQRKRT